MYQSSFRNEPLPIEDNPLIFSNIDGVSRMYPPRKKTEHKAVLPATAPEVKFNNCPQINHPKQVGFITGISVGLSRSLMRAHMHHYARAMEILADFGYLGRCIFRNEFIDLLSQYMSKGAARAAFDEFSGKASNRHPKKDLYKHKVEKGQKLFREFVVKIVPNNILVYILERTKITTNSKVSKRGRKGEGRRGTAWVYIPTEGELKQLLIASGLASESDGLDFLVGFRKPMPVIADHTSYKAFIMATPVFENGEKQYSRKQLAEPIGIHVNSVRKYAERIGIRVTQNEPTLSPIRVDEIQYLPKDKKEYDQWVALKLIPDGIYIQTALKDRFPYTQGGAKAAIAKSKDKGGSGKIFKAHYSASTYDPSTSPLYAPCCGNI